MNRRSFLGSAVATFALATGLARARLGLVDDPYLALDRSGMVSLIEATRELLNGAEETLRLRTTIPLSVGDNLKVEGMGYRPATYYKVRSVTFE